MKYSINLLLLIVFSVSLSGCATLQVQSTAQTEELPKTTQTVPQQDTPMEQDDKILSRDYATAEKALNKAVLEKNKKTIMLGLKNPIFSIKQKTVEAIIEIKDETFVPDLIQLLEGNQGVIAGGTEVQLMQQELNKVIVSALEKLTSLQFSSSEELSPEDIQKILKKSQEWWKNHQGKDR